jgi:plasmid stabilization system protein ParE
MRTRVELSKSSLIDLEGIVEHYFALNKATASRYYREIVGRIRKLATFPQIGRIVPEFEEEFYDKYREIIYENFRIIYRVEGNHAFVLRIVDARRLLSFDFMDVPAGN